MEGDEDGSREKRSEKRFGVRIMWKGRANGRIAKEEGRSRKTVKQIVEDVSAKKRERQGPLVYEPYRARVEELLEENEQVPLKQRYTVSKIYKIIRAEGYSGCESRVRKAGGEVEEEEAAGGGSME